MDLRFRQIHLDFHTSPDIENIGEHFSPEEFADTLAKAHVNSITCFARCHHGMMYYDSMLFPERVHPGLLNKNFLKDQIEACRKRGIRVPIYTTVQWDEVTAREHPEWLALTENGAPIIPDFADGKSVFDAGFYKTLCLNSPYRAFLKAHVKELLEQFDPVDGLFFDIVYVNDCCCRHCVEAMRKEGLHPEVRSERLFYSKKMLDEFVVDMSEFIRRLNKNCSIFYNKSHVGPALKPILNAYSHLELESLPSGGWGYMHFPISSRYARNLGLDCLGMTGKFHTEWGDFHSFKNQAALEYECFRMLALNSKCMVGDQLEPCGRLSQPVYERIGKVYAQIEKKEPWCMAAKAIVDIGVFTQEEFSGPDGSDIPEAMIGVARMLTEGGHQFDVIDSQSEFSKYKVLVLPDRIPVSAEFAQKLRAYINKGGAIIASFESGLNPEKTGFELQELGVRMKPDQTVDRHGELVRGKNYFRAAYADYLLPVGKIGAGLPETEHVMYIKGVEVEAEPEAELLANAILPYFNRTWEHFSSHRQAPSSGKRGYAGIVQNGNTIYFAHPIFQLYHLSAPKWCKTLFLNALELLLPEPVIRHDGPSTLMLTVNEQKHCNRWVIHLLHYIPERRCRDIDIIEDIIPLYHIKISLKKMGNIDRIMMVPSESVIDFVIKEDRVEFIIPELRGHEMIAVSFS